MITSILVRKSRILCSQRMIYKVIQKIGIFSSPAIHLQLALIEISEFSGGRMGHYFILTVYSVLKILHLLQDKTCRAMLEFTEWIRTTISSLEIINWEDTHIQTIVITLFLNFKYAFHTKLSWIEVYYNSPLLRFLNWRSFQRDNFQGYNIKIYKHFIIIKHLKTV